MKKFENVSFCESGTLAYHEPGLNNISSETYVTPKHEFTGRSIATKLLDTELNWGISVMTSN